MTKLQCRSEKRLLVEMRMIYIERTLCLHNDNKRTEQKKGNFTVNCYKTARTERSHLNVEEENCNSDSHEK